jgi:hypothetical protein
MALFEHGILGKVKGAVGDVVVKSNKGTDYSSKRIRHYKKTTSEPLIENRSIFSRRSSFFRFFDESPLISLVWEYSKLPGKEPYHKMFKYNYKSVKKDYVSTLFSILPAKHLGSFRNVKMDADSLSYEFSPEAEFCNTTVPPYYFIAFVYMCSPVDVSLGKREVTGILEQESSDFLVKHNEDNLYQFEVEPSQFEIMKDYKKVVIFPAIVSQNLKNKPVWSKSSGIIVKGDPDPVHPPEKPEDEKPKGPYKTFFMKVK